MLGAYLHALAALHAVAGLAVALGDDVVLPHGTEPGTSLAAVGHGEDLRNGNIHRASVCTVMASGTGNGLVCVQSILCFSDDRMFLRRKRFEISHIRKIVLHLFDVRHAR